MSPALGHYVDGHNGTLAAVDVMAVDVVPVDILKEKKESRLAH